MRKKKYVKPACTFIVTKTNYGILETTSMPGQHEKPNHESGPSPIGGAKKWGNLWENEEVQNTSDNEADDDF
ncbi:hypothetical protein [Segatella maculosa]|uniref:Uncharacterized protein n=1 Tax=Segatella maculosa OT 289 TaxID=999422 RepID=H1HJZ8_9BACT|nr:hypothetical protein [Segatella maculosa]EHO72899.1 hypothetical protein HMPREF9944_00492 [Segatella maculosa OT 289]